MNGSGKAPPGVSPALPREDRRGLPEGVRPVRVRRGSEEPSDDFVAVEEALEIRIEERPLAVTMRTPGDDVDLVAGFLYAEGVIDSAADLLSIDLGNDRADDLVPLNGDLAQLGASRVDVKLTNGLDPGRFDSAQREFRATAACGVCGKRRLEDLCQELPEIEPLEVDLEMLRSLPDRMRVEQGSFALTGGSHAAALFDEAGRLICLREDIGRHNAVDKVIGHMLLEGRVPLRRTLLAVSGRAGFELVQKALRAAVPVMVSVGAASSLAVSMATHAGLSLHSFMGPGRGHLHLP